MSNGIDAIAEAESETMSIRPDKEDRKAKLNAVRAQQQAAAREKLPMSDDQMKSLFDSLDASLTRGCDHTLRLVREWSDALGQPFDSLAAWCRENGGMCDCEVLANCEERWTECR